MENVTKIWRCADTVFDLSQQGEIMGILNVTLDSFSDGGQFIAVEAAIKQAKRMIKEGAAIIDVGGESTRPGAPEVSIKDELTRTIPVIEALVAAVPEICISIDTSKPRVALEAAKVGAKIINDVTGFRDSEMIDVAAETGMGTVVMHMQGSPRTMQQSPTYSDVIKEVRAFFQERFNVMTQKGVRPEAIVFDPGIGFGKLLEHNLTLLKKIDQLEVEQRPILLGVSRKSFIGAILGEQAIEDRAWPTVAITAAATEKGVQLHRVHEVKSNFEALRMMEAIIL